MRQEKTLILDDIQAWIHNAPYLIVTDYTGLTVAQFSELRKRLRAASSELHVVKNTIFRRALSNEKFPELGEDIVKGQIAVAYGASDVSAAAKVLKSFQAEFQLPKVKAGIVERAVLSADQIKALADIPSKDVLRAKILGLLKTPATRLVTLLQTPASRLAQVIKAKAEKTT